MRITEKSLRQIEQQLGRDGVWVSPDLRAEFPARAEQRIEKAVAEARPKIYVALVEVPADHPQFHGRLEDVFATIRDDTGRQGTYVGVERTGGLEPAAYSFGGDDDGSYAGQAAMLRHPDQLIEQVVEAVELVGTGRAEAVYDRLSAPRRPDRKKNAPTQEGDKDAGKPAPDDRGTGETGTGTVPPTESAADDESDGTVVTVGISMAVVLALLAVGIGLALRHRSQTGRGFRMPRIATVRPVGGDRREKLARREVLALGERIEATATSDENDAWQQALDHYDAARRILGGKHEPEDTVGAIVLAARGLSALDAAAEGRDDWKPDRPCYLNPLHGSAVRAVTWRGASAGVDLPACQRCADAIEAGRMPDDVLDFVRDGRPRHYFALDIAPWSSTGYGSLDPDLLSKLHGTRLRIR